MGLDPVTMMAGSFVASTVLSQLLKPKQADQPAPAAPAAPIPAPQASQAPELNDVRKNVAATTDGGEASTLLTGLGGVDPKTLNLGKGTLLGT